MKAKASAVDDVIVLVMLAVLTAISTVWPQSGDPLLLGISGLMVVFATIVLVQGRIGFLRWFAFALIASALACTVLVPKRWPAASRPITIAWFSVLVICAAASLMRWWKTDRRPQ